MRPVSHVFAHRQVLPLGLYLTGRDRNLMGIENSLYKKFFGTHKLIYTLRSRLKTCSYINKNISHFQTSKKTEDLQIAFNLCSAGRRTIFQTAHIVFFIYWKLSSCLVSLPLFLWKYKLSLVTLHFLKVQ